MYVYVWNSLIGLNFMLNFIFQEGSPISFL